MTCSAWQSIWLPCHRNRPDADRLNTQRLSMPSAPQGLSLRRGIGGRGACCLSAGWGWFQDCACLVNRDSVDGGQGGPGRQVMVAAQQQVSRMRPPGGGRDEYPDHRPAWAAAAAIGKARRPGPGDLVDSCPRADLGFAERELHRRSTGTGSRRIVWACCARPLTAPAAGCPRLLPRELAAGGQRSASRTGWRPDGCIR